MRKYSVPAIRPRARTLLMVLFVIAQLLLSACAILPKQAQCDLRPLSDGVIVREGWWYSSEGKLRRKYTFYDGPQGQEVPHGIVYEFTEDGSLHRALTFQHGVAQGPARMYFKSGSIEQSGEYENDLKTGVWQFFYESGRLMARGCSVENT